MWVAREDDETNSDSDSGGAETVLLSGIDALRGKDPKRLHPIHVRAVPWPDWLNDGIALLEKTLDATRARADKRRAKRKARAQALLKQQAAARVEEAKRMADEMQQRERDAKRQEIERQKNRKKTMAAEAAASDKAQRRDMTQEEIQEINKVVRLRRETESQHRSTVFELERLQKESRAAQISLQTIDSWLSDTSAADARKEGEEGTQGGGDRLLFGAAGKCFIREDPKKLMSDLQNGLKK